METGVETERTKVETRSIDLIFSRWKIAAVVSLEFQGSNRRFTPRVSSSTTTNFSCLTIGMFVEFPMIIENNDIVREREREKIVTETLSLPA